jgi:DNA-binding transcriptional LysR family regulator
VPTACDALLKEAPKATITIIVVERAGALAGVRKGEFDLAITTLEPPRHDDVVEEHLYDDEFVVFTSLHHRLAKRKHVTLEELVQERWLSGDINGASQRQLGQAFVDRGLPAPKIVVDSAFLPIRYHMAATSDLLAFSSRAVARAAAARFQIAELRVKDLSITRRVGVIYRKDAYLSPVGLRLIETLKTVARNLAAKLR